MKVIVGLGNPGKRYEKTPHNIGFDVVEKLAGRFGCSFKRSFRVSAWLVRASIEVGDGGASSVLLVKPRTYMNASGAPVAAVLRYHGLDPADLMVVLDDADLDVGDIRIRRQGGSGGHKGLRSIIEQLGSKEFTRVRLGIGHSGQGDDLVDHVLRRFSARDRKLMDAAVDRATEAVMCILASGEEKAMNEYN